MTSIESIWPLFALRVRCGPLELRVIRDEDFPDLLDVVEQGIHEPERMPFLVPWTDAPADTLRTNFLQYHWGKRSEFSQPRWALDLAVFRDGQVVGCQGVSTQDFLVTRTGETGSWLGRRFQGQGIGTLMRQAICTLCFDHLGFTEITSGAFVDNPASYIVSGKVGYVPNGEVRMQRREGELAMHRNLVLTPDAFVRPSLPVEVEGLAGVRRLIGLPD